MKPNNEDPKEISKQVKARMGERFSGQNPFVSSPTFIEAVTMFAVLSKLMLKSSSNSGEALNAFLSLVVTFVKNVPDNLWLMMRKAAEEQDDKSALQMFTHLDGLRSYEGKNYMPFDGTEDIPDFTVRKPTKPV